MPRKPAVSAGPGRGGPARGGGWGGPPKGAGRGGPAKPFTADSPTRVTVPLAEARAANGDRPSAYATRKERDEQRAETLRDHLYALATTAERQETQLSAAVAFLNRVEGLPVARQLIAGDPDGGAVQHAVVLIPCKSGD